MLPQYDQLFVQAVIQSGLISIIGYSRLFAISYPSPFAVALSTNSCIRSLCPAASLPAQHPHSMSARTKRCAGSLASMMDLPSREQSKGRRLATRHATRLSAYFLMGTVSFAVTFRDYCATGVLLGFEQHRASSERLAAWVGMGACIAPSLAALADVVGGFGVVSCSFQQRPHSGQTQNRSRKQDPKRLAA